MNYEISNLYSSRIADSMDVIRDILAELWNYLADIDCNLKEPKEFLDYGATGLTIQSKVTVKKIFVGIWLDCWRISGSPICIIIESENEGKNLIYKKVLSDYCKQNESNGLKYIEVNELPCIILLESFFQDNLVVETLFNHIKEVGSKIDFTF